MPQDAVRSLMDQRGYTGGEYNKFSGTLTYYSVVPTAYKSETRLKGKNLNAHLVKIQINARQVSKDYGFCVFNTLPGVLDDESFRQKVLRPERLFANKIVVSARSENVVVGRARHKDLFDVVALVNYPRKELDYGVVGQEVWRDLRIRGSNHSAGEVIRSCGTNLAGLLENNAAGFYSSYKIPGAVSQNMEKLVEKTKKTLEKINL